MEKKAVKFGLDSIFCISASYFSWKFKQNYTDSSLKSKERPLTLEYYVCDNVMKINENSNASFFNSYLMYFLPYYC